MLRNFKMFFWGWREIHLYFHNLPIKQPSYMGGKQQNFPLNFLRCFCANWEGKNKIIFMSRSCGRNQLGHRFSSRSLRKQWIKNRKKTPKMKCQLSRALLLPFQGHFCVTCLPFSRDNPGIKEKAAFPSRKQKFHFSSANFLSLLPCSRGLSVSTEQHFSHAGFLWNSEISLPLWEDGAWWNWRITAASVEGQDVLSAFPWEGKGIFKYSLLFSALLAINPCWEFFSGQD